jgi:hypothetical protein
MIYQVVTNVNVGRKGVREGERTHGRAQPRKYNEVYWQRNVRQTLPPLSCLVVPVANKATQLVRIRAFSPIAVLHCNLHDDHDTGRALCCTSNAYFLYEFAVLEPRSSCHPFFPPVAPRLP